MNRIARNRFEVEGHRHEDQSSQRRRAAADHDKVVVPFGRLIHV